jgi:DNA-binding MurR/RpiR family transcriptional regulator
VDRVSERSIQARVHDVLGELPDAQRRVAELAVADPEALAFGTVQSVAERTGTSAPTVVRVAAALGFDGYTALRDAIRVELSTRLRSAAERLQQPVDAPLFTRTRTAELANVDQTLAGLDPAQVDRAVALLADPERRVWIMPSSQLAGVGTRFADELSLIRSRVRVVDGAEFRVHTILAAVQPGDVLVTFDIQRHEAWLVRAQRAAVARGAVPIAVTDRLPCSLELTGGEALTFSCETPGPFESQVGAVIVANLLVNGVVDLDRSGLAERVDVLEQVWRDDQQFGS